MSTQYQFEPYATQLYQALLDRKPPFPFRRRLDESITYASPTRFQQLQAADLAAYRLAELTEKKFADPDYPGTEKELRFLGLAHQREDLKIATGKTFDKQCALFARRRKETNQDAHIRRNRQRVQVSHDPEECLVIGKVDAAGNYRVVDRLD